MQKGFQVLLNSDAVCHTLLFLELWKTLKVVKWVDNCWTGQDTYIYACKRIALAILKSLGKWPWESDNWHTWVWGFTIYSNTLFKTWSSDIVRSGVSFLERKNDFTNFLMMYRFKEKILGIIAFGEFLKPSWNIRNICKIAIEFFINQFAIFRLYSINQQLSKLGLLVGFVDTLVHRDIIFIVICKDMIN